MSEEKNTDKARAYVFDLMHLLARNGGTDLYVTAGSPAMIRVSGKLKKAGSDKLMPAQTMALATSLMDQRLRDQFMESSECNFAVSVPDVSRFRVNAYIQRGSASMVIRQISTNIPTLDDLNMPPVMRDLVMAKRGLLVLAGATGQGKSTTMAALLNHRNEHGEGHIVTVEDPVEFIHAHKNSLVSQREVGTDTDSFDSALQNALRQSPDVVMIGEIRDRQTMERALEIAETGHLCVCTLHANNTMQAVNRIAGFFPTEERSQIMYGLSLNLRAVVSQRLITNKPGTGRVPAVELMINTPVIRDLISRGEIAETKKVLAKSRDLGMQTFDQSLSDLAMGGFVDGEEAVRNADIPNDVRTTLKSEGVETSRDGSDELELQAKEDMPKGRYDDDDVGQAIRR